ncbi:uncharacterized protein TNCV_113571 [Trichonephila clavipes]|nr:uncharacterized protein TNCV_113571 [Trichonephila clavipes]
MNCREQAYDNAATMAGCHTGVQQRIKDINPNAKFVPCSNHSLNLVCVHAASVETVLEAKREEFVDNALIYAKSLCEELGISFGPQDESGGSIYLATEPTTLLDVAPIKHVSVLMGRAMHHASKAHTKELKSALDST